MITIRVKLFAIYQEAYGREELQWQCADQAPVGTILDRILTEHPHLQSWRSLTRFGINYAFAPPGTPLNDGDEVVLIPPVSGG